MSKVQRVSAATLEALAAQECIRERIGSKELRGKIVSNLPARSHPGGRSQLVCYYDSCNRHVCTVHRIVVKQVNVHWHVKDLTIGDTKYCQELGE